MVVCGIRMTEIVETVFGVLGNCGKYVQDMLWTLYVVDYTLHASQQMMFNASSFARLVWETL